MNRVARPYYLQALRALERGVASVPELDALARSAGFAMGPFELMDLIGLDVNLATSESVYQRTQAERLEPAQSQRIMVAEGLLGRKCRARILLLRQTARRSASSPRRRRSTSGPIRRSRGDRWVRRPRARARRADRRALRESSKSSQTTRCSTSCCRRARLSSMPATAPPTAARSSLRLDASFEKECVIVADAYATNLSACVQRMRHGERLVGFGALGSVASQSAVEIVNSEEASDDALELAQELFASIGKGAVLVEDVPGLFLGRTVGSIVNEAMIAVAQDVASPEDVDEAMMLGANYPAGPIAWGREIGGTRVRTILRRLADAEGDQFAPHRSLWLLDVETVPAEETPQ